MRRVSGLFQSPAMFEMAAAAVAAFAVAAVVAVVAMREVSPSARDT
jgi:hypothetical protein